MSVTLHIPDSITSGLRLPESEIESRLRMELAVALYKREILSFGKSVELAGVNRYQFGELLKERGVARHYGPDELSEDVGYARS